MKDLWHDPLFLVGLISSEEGGSASGDIVSFDAPRVAPLRSLRVGIDPVQDLHGYDAPWPAGGGANKANLETATVCNDGTYGMSVTIDKTAETITMSGTWTGAAVQSWRFLNTPDIDTSLSIKAFGLTSGSHISSVTQDGAENRLIIQLNNMVSGTAYTISFKLFAYSGTAPTSWTPYSNLCPISGWSAANLWRTGKNLLDDSVKSLYGNQICIGGQGEALLYNNVSVHLKAGTYTLSVITDDGTSPSGIYMGYTGESGYKAVSYSGGKLTFTITEERDIVVWAYKDGYGSVGVSAVKSAQLELGSTPTPYAPYTGTTYPVTIPVLGKNLLQTSELTHGTPSDTTFSNATKRTFTPGTYVTGLTNSNYYQNQAGNAVVSDNSIKFSTSAKAYGVSIPVLGLEIGSKYTISAVTAIGLVGLSFYQQDGTYISGGSAFAATHSPYTATIPENTYYTLVCFTSTENDSETTFTNIQLEKGSTATAYEPYTNTVYGGYISVSEDGSAELVVTLAYDQMTYSYLSGLSSGYIGYGQQVWDGATRNVIWVRNWNYQTAKERTSGGIEAYCNAFKVSMNDKSIFSSQYRTYFDVGSMADITAFLSAVEALEIGGSGLYIAYELATPLHYPLSDITISTLKGQNVVWGDCGEVAVEWAGAKSDLPMLVWLMNRDRRNAK